MFDDSLLRYLALEGFFFALVDRFRLKFSMPNF